MDDRLVDAAEELIKSYGVSLLEDPDRLGHLLEDRRGEARRGIFVITFALRELLRNGPLPAPDAFAAECEKFSARMRENLGFSEADARWAARAIAGLLAAGAESAPDETRIEARRGFLRGIGYVIAKHPRTMLVRKKALSNGLLLIAIIALFLGLFVQVTGPIYNVQAEYGVLFLAHLSGPDAAFGHVRLKAAQLAADQINADGGVKRRSLKIRAHDIPRAPEDAARVVDALLRGRDSLAVISVCGDDVNAAISGIADARETPFIVTESSGMAVTMADPDRPRLYPFRMNYDNSYRGYIAAYFLTRALKRTRPAVIREAYDADAYETRDGFVSAIEGFGGSVACEEVWTKAGGIDRASVEEIGLYSADSVVILNDKPDIAPVIRALRDFGYDGVIVGLAFDESLDRAAGNALDNSWWIVPAHPDDPQLQSFKSAYRDKYNESVSRDDFYGTLFAYDSVYWVKDAVSRAPGFQGEAMRHAFMSTRNLPLSHATLTMDPRTHGPWRKAVSLIHRPSGGARFDRRFRPPQ
jgi:branched-chain amino acid transport system substrate-binding protein